MLAGNNCAPNNAVAANNAVGVASFPLGSVGPQNASSQPPMDLLSFTPTTPFPVAFPASDQIASPQPLASFMNQPASAAATSSNPTAVASAVAPGSIPGFASSTAKGAAVGVAVDESSSGVEVDSSSPMTDSTAEDVAILDVDDQGLLDSRVT